MKFQRNFIQGQRRKVKGKRPLLRGIRVPLHQPSSANSVTSVVQKNPSTKPIMHHPKRFVQIRSKRPATARQQPKAPSSTTSNPSSAPSIQFRKFRDLRGSKKSINQAHRPPIQVHSCPSVVKNHRAPHKKIRSQKTPPNKANHPMPHNLFGKS